MKNGNLNKNFVARHKLMTLQIKVLRNSALCLKCNDKIESRHRHDFKMCSCGEISVDGGREYIKASATDFENFKSTSIVMHYWKIHLPFYQYQNQPDFVPPNGKIVPLDTKSGLYIEYDEKKIDFLYKGK